jgi:hypothetical protein
MQNTLELSIDYFGIIPGLGGWGVFLRPIVSLVTVLGLSIGAFSVAAQALPKASEMPP